MNITEFINLIEENKKYHQKLKDNIKKIFNFVRKNGYKSDHAIPGEIEELVDKNLFLLSTIKHNWSDFVNSIEDIDDLNNLSIKNFKSLIERFLTKELEQLYFNHNQIIINFNRLEKRVKIYDQLPFENINNIEKYTNTVEDIILDKEVLMDELIEDFENKYDKELKV